MSYYHRHQLADEIILRKTGHQPKTKLTCKTEKDVFTTHDTITNMACQRYQSGYRFTLDTTYHGPPNDNEARYVYNMDQKSYKTRPNSYNYRSIIRQNKPFVEALLLMEKDYKGNPQ